MIKDQLKFELRSEWLGSLLSIYVIQIIWFARICTKCELVVQLVDLDVSEFSSETDVL